MASQAARPPKAVQGGKKGGGANPLASKKHKWKSSAFVRPSFDVHKFSPSIMVWTEAECNPWRRVMFKSPRDRSDEELDMLEETLTPKVEWLRRVVPPIRRDIYRRCRLERLRKGDVLFEQGDSGTAFYIILSGMVNVNVRVEDCTRLEDIHMIKHIFEKGEANTLNSNGQHTVNTLGPMQWFGGMALGDASVTRMASIVAIENTLLMAIPRSDFEMAVRAYEAGKAITALDTLQSTAYFHDCPLASLKRLAAVSSIHEFPAGELVVAQDTPAHSLVIVISGSLHVFRQLPLPLEIRQGLFGVEAAMKGEKKATESQAAGKACLKIADFVASDTLGIETILNQHHMHRFTLKAVTRSKLSLMRLPSDESILRRISRGLNWDLFKVGLMTSISEKLRGTLGSRITVAKSAQDFRFSPAFDKEALDIVDEALMPKAVTGNTRLEDRRELDESMGLYRRRQPHIRYNPHRVLRSVRGSAAAEVTLPPSTSKGALRRLHGSMSTPALIPNGKSFRSSAKTLESWNTDRDVTMEALTEGARVPRKWEEQYLQTMLRSPPKRLGSSSLGSTQNTFSDTTSTLPAALRSLRRARSKVAPHTAPLNPSQMGLIAAPRKHRPLSTMHRRRARTQKRQMLRAAIQKNPTLRKSASLPAKVGSPRKADARVTNSPMPGIPRVGTRKRKDVSKMLKPPPLRSTPLMLRGISRSRPATRQAYAQIVREDRVDQTIRPSNYASRKHETSDSLFRGIGVGLQTLGDENQAEEFIEAVSMGNLLSLNRLLHKVSLATLKFAVEGANGETKTSEAAKLMPRVKEMYERRLAEAERAKINMRLYGNPYGAGHNPNATTGIYSSPGGYTDAPGSPLTMGSPSPQHRGSPSGFSAGFGSAALPPPVLMSNPVAAAKAAQDAAGVTGAATGTGGGSETGGGANGGEGGVGTAPSS